MKVRDTITLITASVSVFFEALDIAIINLAMPLIQHEFHLTQSSVQWLQTLYVLVYGGFLILGGKLSDVYGRKSIFLSGSALFLLTSLGAALSSSFVLLAVFRAAQGLAAALVMPSAMAIITNTFTEPRERSKAVAIFSSFAALGSGSGLSIGGLLASFFGWKSVFFINVPVIAITLLLGYRYIPSSSAQRRASPDILSGILITTSLICLSYLVHSLQDALERPLLVIMLLVAAVLSSIGFFYRNNHSEPLIDFTLMRSRETIFGNVTMILMGASFTGFLFLISLILQDNMNFNPAEAGFALFPFSVLSALVGKFLIPVLLKRLTVIQIAITGMACMVTGSLFLLIAFYTNFNLVFVLLAAACVTGLGIAIAFTGLTVLSLHKLAPEHHGLGSSMGMTGYFFGAGLGLAILSSFMSSDPGLQHVAVTPVIVLLTYASIGVLCLAILIRRTQQIAHLTTHH